MSIFGYSGKEVSQLANIHESKIRRFRKNKIDLEACEFFQMLESMPQEAQDFFWVNFRPTPNLHRVIAALPTRVAADIAVELTSRLPQEYVADLMSVIAKRFKSGELELESKSEKFDNSESDVLARTYL